MIRRHCAIAILSVLLRLAVSGAAAGADADVASLIRTLGSSRSAERREAACALLRIGKPARAALEEAARSDDPEIRLNAVEILRDLEYGINPDWPDDLRARVRGFDRLSPDEKGVVMDMLVREYRKDAVPFLLARVTEDSGADAAMAVERLKRIPDKKAVWTAVLDELKNPVNKEQMDLLASACEWSKAPSDIVRGLSVGILDNSAKSRLVQTAVGVLREQFDRRAFGGLETNAAAFCAAAPGEARFGYYRAVALSELGRTEEAEKAAGKALSLDPESEGSHYAAGEMLLDIGRLRLSEKEWKKILEIPPADDVYDLNAYMRLGTIYARCGMFAKAADMLETGRDKYKEAKEKHGSGMGMIGEGKLDEQIAAFRQRAREADPAENRNVHDVSTEELTVTITTVLKGAKQEDMAAELRDAAMEMTVTVQPHGLRLMGEVGGTLEYDPEAREIRALLHGSACARPARFECKRETENVAVNDLDMCHIFRIHRDTGKAEKIKSFERDYILAIRPTAAIRAWKEATVTVNGKAYSWKDLDKGLPFDHLPAEIDLRVDGTAPSGEEQRIRRAFDPKDFMGRSGTPDKPTVIRVKIEIGTE